MSVSHASLTPMPLDFGEVERLGLALEGLTPNQLQWVSAYAAGMAAAGVSTISQTMAPASVQATGDVLDSAGSLTILFGSQTGNGEELAKRLAEQARERGFSVNLQNLADYKPAGLKREKFVTFVISTHGEGDPPDDAELFREFLLSSKSPRLTGLKFSVLALGDSSYINFCQTGREFDRRLAELGAERLLPIVECDLDYDDIAGTWTGDVLEILPGVFDAGSEIPKLHAVAAPAKFDKNRPFPAQVLVNQKITGVESSKDVRHIELSLEGSGFYYEPGDALAVVATNPPGLVNQVLDVLGLQADREVMLRHERVRLDKALTHELEITAASLGFLKSWAEISAHDELRGLLNHQARLGDLIATHQIIDIVRRFPAATTAQSFVDSLRKLSPRSYSIASSLEANPDEVHLTVAAVRYRAFDSDHWGAASTHLADRLAEGDSVDVYIEKNSRFRLPVDDSSDIIMIGPGTGVAPFRAFVEERALRTANGKNWLFFGDRSFSSDFLYQLEWQRHLKQGHLDRLDLAFSRDQAEKIYVQDRIRQHGGDVYRWIERGAHIYVCGDAKRMAGDVDDALVEVFASYGNVNRIEAEKRLKEMRRAGRYQRDVY